MSQIHGVLPLLTPFALVLRARLMSYYGRYSDDEDYDDGYYYEAESYGEDSESDEYEYEEVRGHYTLSTPIEHHASAPSIAEAQAATGKRKVSSTH